MATVPQDLPQSVILQLFNGIKNTVTPERLLPSDLEAAVNIDLDDAGQARRRRGFAKVSDGAFHSLFSGAAKSYAVKDGVLGILGTNYNFTALQALVGPHHLAYVEVGEHIYYSSLTDSGIIHSDDTVTPWGTVGGDGTWLSPVLAPTETLGLVSGKLLGAPPMATSLTEYSGRIYMAVGPVLWATELYLHRFVDKTRTFIQFESDITALMSVDDGLFVGTDVGLFFLSGPFAQMSRKQLMSARVLPGSATRVPGELVHPDARSERPYNLGDAAMFVTDAGICAGFIGGACYNLTETRMILPHAASAAVMFRQQDGINQFVAVTDNGGTPATNTRIGDYVAAEIVRHSADPTGLAEGSGFADVATMNRRFSVALSEGVGLAQELLAEAPSTTGKIGVNLQLYGNSYFGTQYPFIDRMKTSRYVGASPPWQGRDSGYGNASTPLPINAQGYPTAFPGDIMDCWTLVGLDPLTGPNSDDYMLTWDGAGTVYPPGALVSSAPNSIRFTAVTPPGEFVAITALPVTNIKIVSVSHVALEASGETFTPEFLAKCAQWDVLRFMQWGQNATTATETSWGDRYPLNYASWGETVPLEVMVDLCNAAGTDMWYCLPYTADDTYVTNAAAYIRDNLDSQLKVHIEWSNETWNFTYPVWGYCDDAGQGGTVFPADPAKGYKYAGYRAAQVAALCNTVFAGAPTRLRNVLGAQADYPAVVNYKKIGALAASVGAIATLFDEVAIATYFGDTLSGHNAPDRATILGWAGAGSTGVDDAFEELEHGGLLTYDRKDLDYAITNFWEPHNDFAVAEGLALVAYEGGAHLVPNSGFSGGDVATMLAFFETMTADTRMGTLYTRMMTEFRALSEAEELIIYADSGQPGDAGLWGMLDSTYDSSSPRYDAAAAFQASPP